MSIPDSSQRPMPRVMVITRPRGANPVKFFTILSRNQWRPSVVNRLADVTASPDAGLVSVSPVMVKIAPITAVNRNSQQKKDGRRRQLVADSFNAVDQSVDL